MRVLILCAGYATRLYPLTENMPKPLLPVGAKPMLEWILDRVKEIKDVQSVCVISNHKFAGHFERWAASAQYPWRIDVVDDQTTNNDNRLGAIGDLAFALNQKKIGTDDLLVLAGDNLFTFDLVDFVENAKKHRPGGSIAVYDVKDRELAKQYGLVLAGPTGRVDQFLEKPQNPPTTLASCGIYWLPGETRTLLDKYLADGHNPDQPGHYMRWLAETAVRLYAVPLKGEWFDIGDHASYEKANTRFKKVQS